MGIFCLLVLSNSMSRTDAQKANWLFFSFISYYWQRCSSNSSRVHSLRDAFPLLSPLHLVLYPVFPRPALVLALCSHWSCYLHDLKGTTTPSYTWPREKFTNVYICEHEARKFLCPPQLYTLGNLSKSYRKDASPKYFLSSGSKMLFQPNLGRAEGKRDIPWENESSMQTCFEFKGMSCYLMWSIHMKVKWNPHRNKRLTWLCLQGSC